MPETIKLSYPNGPREQSGESVTLDVAGEPVKFFTHRNEDGSCTLSHHASGKFLARLEDPALVPVWINNRLAEFETANEALEILKAAERIN